MQSENFMAQDAKALRGTGRSKVLFMAESAVIAALLCILSPISVPIGPVPISLATLVLYFAAYTLGTRRTAVAYAIYMLIGIAGLPVFSGYAGGIAKLAGPTGGYLIGFLPLVIIVGIISSKFRRKIIPSYLGMVLGTAAAYALGTLWFVYQMQCTLPYALSVCVLPFIPVDLIKMAAAIALGRPVRHALFRMTGGDTR